MQTYYEPDFDTTEVKILKSVDTEKIIESLDFYLQKITETNKQVGLKWANDFEGISDLRYKDANPLQYTQDDFTNWQPKTDYVQQLANELNINKPGRVRLLSVNPRSCYSFHHDPHPYRVHIPLITNPGAFMVIGGKIWHLKIGFAYRVRVAENHTALNTGETSRIHLVFDNIFE